jgi:[ribosomal protein S5]-alanine N-acetyltransferase
MNSYFLSGERIYLREVRPTDVNDNYYQWLNSPNVTTYLESRFFPHSVESLRAYCEAQFAASDIVFLAIVLKDGDRHIGNIKLSRINWIHRTAEVGLLIGEEDCWGQGFATEAIRVISVYAFETLNLRKITAGCYSSNPASAGAFEKAGFIREGVLPGRVYDRGNYVDTVLLGLDRSASHPE